MPDTGRVHNTQSRVGINVRDNPSDALLEELVENFEWDTQAFKDIRDAGSEDIKFIANDPWPEKEKEARKQLNRPIVAIDILNQYTNLIINEVRQHPREIKISPAGYGATAQLAEFRENRVRAIQYRSQAQDAYITMLENACQRSYGYLRILLAYESEKSFEQIIKICRVPNPDAILFDQACKEIDCSDAKHCFVLDQILINEFKRKYPKASITDFDGLAGDYPEWVKEKFIQIAEYWRVEEEDDELVQFMDPKVGPLSEFLSSLKGARLERKGDIQNLVFGSTRYKVVQTREAKRKKIVQYITNGVEILEENAWLGKWIPIVPCFGKELYLDEAQGSKRVLQSLIRNARDAQMGYNYFKTCEMEAASMVPKSNWMAAEGQFEGHEEEVEDANRSPKAFLYYKARVEGMTADDNPLPPPQRDPFDPPIQNLEIGAESFAKAAQSAIGMYNSSIGKNDTNVKSGRAIEELDEQSDLGSYHFIANYNRAIAAAGRIVNDLISKVEVNEREVPIMKKDRKEMLVKINTDQPVQGPDGDQYHYQMKLGEFDVTVSVGPNEDSERDAAQDFLKTLVQELAALVADPAKREQILALSIKYQQMGPIMDEVVKILAPEPGDPQQLQAQSQQLQQLVQQLQQENAALHEDRAGRVLEQQTKIHLEAMKQDNENFRSQLANDIKVLIAEIQAKSQDDQQRQQMYQTFWQENHGAAHEAAMQAQDHAQEHAIADKQAAIQQSQQQSDQAHEAGMTAMQNAQPDQNSTE